MEWKIEITNYIRITRIVDGKPETMTFSLNKIIEPLCNLITEFEEDVIIQREWDE